MSGLFSAAYLRRIGWEVEVYERSGVPLVGRGAGITTHPELLTALEACGADQFFKFMVFKDPGWDYRGFDFDADMAFAVNNFGHIINATSPDLRAFQKNGSKILHYHSYRSTTHTAPKSIEYYEEVAAFMNHRRRGELKANDLRKTQEFYRLFMAPGGSGNKGPEKFDPLPYLELWVEEGIAPDRIIASNFTAGVVNRTRPLCPHPQVAVYKGSGSIDAAENFVCRNR